MSRRNTQAINSIQRICHIQRLAMDDVYARAKLLLSIYRDVCWSTAVRAEDLEDNLICYCSGELSDALVYLETFAPAEKKVQFEGIPTFAPEHFSMIEQNNVFLQYQFPQKTYWLQDTS